MAAPGGLARALLVALPLTAAAVVATWPADERVAPRPFQAPGLVRVEFPEGEGRVADLSAQRGRITALQRLDMVLAWLPEVSALEVHEPEGVVELLLGDRARSWCSLVVLEEGMRLSTGEGAEVKGKAQLPRPPSRRVALSHDGGRVQVRVDGEALDAGWPADEPSGASRVGLWTRASLQALVIDLPDGQHRRLQVEAGDGGPSSTWWAGLSALLGSLATAAWWATRRRSPPGARAAAGDAGSGAPAGAPGVATTGAARGAAGGAWTLAALVALALPTFALLGLAERNAERLSAPLGELATEAHVQDGPVEVVPGRPLDLHPRRDADMVLTASLELTPGSLVDVLVHGSEPVQDLGVIVGLSSREGVPCDTVVNLGATLEREPAAPARAPGVVRLEVVTEGPDVHVSLDGEHVATRRCHDLRAGRTAIMALSGSATVRELRIDPGPTLEGGHDVLGGWLLRFGALLAVGLGALAGLWRRPALLLWCWPLAAAAAPGAPDGVVWPAEVLAALLLLLTPSGRATVIPWALGALLLVTAHRARHEGPPPRPAVALAPMEVSDVRGGPVPPDLVWARHPLTRRFNPWSREQTLRGERVSPAAPDDTLRVLALGSSSTFGYGVDGPQAWPAQLERLLEGGAAPVEVLNAGVPGGTARRLLFTLEHALLELAPDVVVVSLSFNDHIDLAVHDETAHFDAFTSDGIGWLDQQLARWAARGTRKRWLRYFGSVMDGHPPEPDDREACVLAPSRRFAATLEAMARAVRDRGGEVVFVQEPPRDAVHPHVLGPYHEAIAALGARLDAPVCAPKAALDRAAEPRGAPLYLDMIHLDSRGHVVMAQQVAQTLRQAGLVPR